MPRASFVFDDDPLTPPCCHASTIVEAPDGAPLAAWFAGTDEGEPDVDVRLARLEGSVWTAPVVVADGRGPQGRAPCWNPVLARARAPDGPLLLFYKVGPDPTAWRGMLRRSHDGGRTWGAPERLPEDFVGPARAKPVETPDGVLLCGSSVEAGGWRAHVEAFDANGRPRWRTPAFEDPLGLRAIQPALVSHGAGVVQALCRTLRHVVAESWSGDGGRTWTALTPTSLLNPNSCVEALRLADGRALLVHNPLRDGRDVLALSLSDDGRAWRPGRVLEAKPRAELSYPAAVQTRDGRIHVTYTWNRTRVRHVVLEPDELGAAS